MRMRQRRRSRLLWGGGAAIPEQKPPRVPPKIPAGAAQGGWGLLSPPRAAQSIPCSQDRIPWHTGLVLDQPIHPGMIGALHISSSIPSHIGGPGSCPPSPRAVCRVQGHSQAQIYPIMESEPSKKIRGGPSVLPSSVLAPGQRLVPTKSPPMQQDRDEDAQRGSSISSKNPGVTSKLGEANRAEGKILTPSQDIP